MTTENEPRPPSEPEPVDPTPEPSPEPADGPRPAPDAEIPALPRPAAPPLRWGPPSNGTNGFAVAALVVGIVGACGCIGILGLVFGSIAMRQIAETGERGEGLAKAGIVLGWISVAFTALWLIAYIGRPV